MIDTDEVRTLHATYEDRGHDWIDAQMSLLDAVPGLLDELDRLRSQLSAAEEDAARTLDERDALRREMGM
jgi:hypothetical protein